MIPPQVESALAAAYREEAACYARALKAADGLLLALGQGTNPTILVAPIVEELTRVAHLEHGIRANKDLWQQAGKQPGPDLRAAIDLVAAMIQDLQEKMAPAGAQASARQQALAPEVDTFILGRQMRRAYEQSQPVQPPSA